MCSTHKEVMGSCQADDGGIRRIDLLKVSLSLIGIGFFICHTYCLKGLTEGYIWIR